MHNKTLRTVLFWMLLGMILSCTPQSETVSLLHQAQRLVDTNPDSALVLIDSIFYPEKGLNREQYMEYLVTRTQVRYKNYQDITADTFIFEARDYFMHKGKKPKQTALAQFYSGCVYREQKNNEKAMLYYQEALSSAQQSGEQLLQGLITYNIGDLLADDGNYIEAKKSYQQSAGYYKNEPDKLAHTFSAIGRMFLLIENSDSAFYYFHKGLDIANKISNIPLQRQLSQRLGLSYREIREFKQAERYLRYAYTISEDSTEYARYYLNLAKLYKEMGLQDSVILYTKKLKENIPNFDDIYFKVSAYNYLTDINKQQKDYQSASYYQTKALDAIIKIMEDQSEQSIYKIQQKYNNEQLQNKYNTQLIKHQQWVIGLLSLLLLALIIGYYFLQRIRKAKQQALQMHNNIQTVHKTNKDLVEQNKSYQSNETSLQETLRTKLETQRKIINWQRTLTEQYVSTNKTTLESLENIVYDNNREQPHVGILQTIEQLHPNLSAFINTNYTDLSELEYFVCILSFAEMNVQEVAFILKQTENVIYKTRSSLNKSIGQNFCSVLKKAYSKDQKQTI